MRKISFYALMLAMSAMLMTSCDNEPNNKPKPTPTPEPEVKEGVSHFDIWVPVSGNEGGMRAATSIVKRTTDLSTGVLDIKNSGVDITEDPGNSVIIKGKYYYSVSKEGTFGKYQITADQLVTVKKIPFADLKDRRYTHAWINDNTLVLIGSNGNSDKILWAKINTDNMVVMDKGEIALPTPPEGQTYNTSGIAAYRKADNKILYSFTYNKKKGKTGTEPKPEFYMAFVNADNMKREKVVTETRAEQMAATAYGELRQDKAFFDEKGDYYLACNSVLPGEKNEKGVTTTTAQHGALLRIKSGEMDFDKSFNGYKEPRGKIVTATYLKNGKALLYMQDPIHTTGNPVWSNKTNPYVFYWIVVDLASQTFKELKDVPYSAGNFSQMAVVVGSKAYIGTNPAGGNATLYIYDLKTEKVTKGMTLADKMLFERIVWMKD